MMVAFVFTVFPSGGVTVMIHHTKLVRNANGNVHRSFDIISLNNLVLVM